jgi:NCS2 family nucleobase:cation symporter-2
VVTGLFLALHGFGALAAAQRFNDEHWKRPDLEQIRRGLFAEGITNIVSSFFNGIPLTSSGGAVSLAAATGCTSRRVAYWLGGLLILLTFMPKAIAFWEILPESIIGAALIFLASYTTLAGLQIIASRLLDNRKILTTGIALILGISYEPLRPLLENAAVESTQSLIFTGVALGVLTAVFLSALFRLRDHTRERKRFDAKTSSLDDVVGFLEHQGKRWGARPELVHRAEYASWQAFESLTEYLLTAHPDQPTDAIEISTVFNVYTFTVILAYRGAALPLITKQPSHEEMLESENGLLNMSAYLLRRLADQVKISHKDGISELQLIFKD